MIKNIGTATLLSLSLLGLSACQNTPSNIHTSPTKPIIVPQAQNQESTTTQSNKSANVAQATNQATSQTPHKVIFIDTPPPIVPIVSADPASSPTNSSTTQTPTVSHGSSDIIIVKPTKVPRQDSADILTSPSSSDPTSINTSPDNLPNTVPSTAPSTADTIVTQTPTQPATTTQPDSTRSTAPAQPARPPVIVLPEPDRRTPQQILLERARSHSQAEQKTRTPTLENGDNVPAFQRLMQTGIAQLQAGDYSGADSTFTRAQRLAPQSSAVYFYLGQVAIKRNQPRRAEAMARRGLVVAQDDSRRRGLWQVILYAGEMQQSARVINEARRALATL